MKTNQPFQWKQHIRTKRPGHRFGGVWAQGMLMAIPWVNVIILVAVLLVVNSRIAITAGVVFELPSAPLHEGSQSGLTVLMFSVSRETQAGEETLVFFDDERYLIQDEEQIARLANRISASISIERHDDVLLLADKRVPHGDVMQFVNIARKAGAKRINVAEKPE